ncbi:Oidioi.mRNA.OKI2018_I69.XSR.g15687.t1.cds [Oikopleura dioica]|uniref:Oidioi.mRNA.OKI2018_I69.XSR.g15687.t1.cds n=1 Tax=Oikopleura dioica TaxID=34765 RepID=A0ABN7SIR0_OIKDI|nr:Oidioi.mRNA.OKI2018_I69.XSR.g15687.t1.cds [Oikopleura dioica]
MVIDKKQIKKLKSLKWLHPHSVFGVLTFIMGLIITASSIFGNYLLVGSHFLHIYLLSCALNSIFGVRILQGSPDVRLGFKFGISLQLCLCYVSFRLRPKNLHFSYNLVPLNLLDKIIATYFLILVFYSIVGGIHICFTGKDLAGNKTPRVVCGIMFLGGLGILFMSLYPLQLAFQGESWLTCIEDKYPFQRQGFAGYVYVPTTWAVAIIFFGVTLVMRKIVTVEQLNYFGITSVVLVLITTVILQEYHIPFISTQKLFIPCGTPEENSWSAWASESLDFSAGAQKIWANILGRPLQYPSWFKDEL